MDVLFPPLIEARLVVRQNRFVVHAELPGGELVKAHTNNTGRMRTCSDPGSRVFLSKSDNPKRNLKYSLVLVEGPEGALVGVDTSLPGKLFIAAMARHGLPGLESYAVKAMEVTVAPGCRLDVELAGPRPAYVELKNVTLMENGRLYFPDAVTVRGAKHLRELASLKASRECDAFAVFVVQRSDGAGLSPADHIDPNFGAVLREVATQGVVPLAYRAALTPQGATITEAIPIIL
jgi:sugar fermentation stimulation protein A